MCAGIVGVSLKPHHLSPSIQSWCQISWTQCQGVYHVHSVILSPCSTKSYIGIGEETAPLLHLKAASQPRKYPKLQCPMILSPYPPSTSNPRQPPEFAKVRTWLQCCLPVVVGTEAGTEKQHLGQRKIKLCSVT